MTPPILGRLQVTPSLSDGAAKGSLFLVLLIGCGWSHANRQGILEFHPRHMDGIIPGGEELTLCSIHDRLTLGVFRDTNRGRKSSGGEG